MKISTLINSPLKKTGLFLCLSLLFTGFAFASGSVSSQALDLTSHSVGYLSLIIFVLAYALVMTEEFTQQLSLFSCSQAPKADSVP